MTHPTKTYLAWLADMHRTGRMDRRQFLGRAAAAGLTAPAITGLLSTSVLAAGPKKGGRMVLATRHGATNDSLDPALLTHGGHWAMTYAIASTLTETLPSGETVPSLAEGWDASADAKVWTFKLRSGVTFHSGKPLTADDVIASINYHRGADSKSFVKPIADEIVEIKADGPLNVVFTLKAGNADFPTSLSSAGFAIYAAKDGTIDFAGFDGTGAYVMKTFEPGVRAEMVKNPNYWRTDRGHADAVELLTIADATARTNALINGSVDAVDQVDVKTVELLSRNQNIVIEETTGPLHYTFPMRTDAAPFDDNNVRMALKHAINRQELLDKVLRGHGSIGNDNPIGPSYRYHAEDIPQREYDPEKAKWYLQQAGLSSLKVDLSAAEAAYTGAVDASVLFQAQAAPAGIEINVVRESNDGYWDNIWMSKPFCACYWGGYTTESEMFTTGYSPGAAWNDTFWTQEKFEELRTAAKAELDTAKRADMYREMQMIVRDEGGAIVPLFANNVYARSTKLAHGDLESTSTFDGARIAERWWVA
jgi:peptide/nickel transport system substrate-binding protein